MRSTLRQPLFFLILLVVSLLVLTVAAEGSAHALGVGARLSPERVARRAAPLVLPAGLLALALTPLAAARTGRGGSVLVAALAFAVLLFLPGALGDPGESEVSEARPAPPASRVPTRRFVPAASQGEFLYVIGTGGGTASEVITVTTAPGAGEPRLSYAADVPLRALPLAPEALSGVELVGMEPALLSLREDLERVVSDIRDTPARSRRRMLRLAAPLFYLAGLVVVVRLSTWPAVAAAVSLLLARAGLVLYRLLSSPALERTRSQLGDYADLFPSLVVLGCGLLLILVDLLAAGPDSGPQGVWRE